MNIGKLYDRDIANTYDLDRLWLLAGGREIAFNQINALVSDRNIAEVLDLAVGTGESLKKVRDVFPNANLHGIDLSSEMLEIAKTKLPFHAIHDDVANTGRHFEFANVDLILMHFLTTFLDGNAVVRDTSKLLRCGGHFSVISSTYDAFPRIHQIAGTVVSEEFLRQANPAPMNADTVAGYLTNAGLDVIAIDTLSKTVRFSDFDDFYQFGMNSGFFTHILTKIDPRQIDGFRQMTGIFPLEDQYKATIVLARKLEGTSP